METRSLEIVKQCPRYQECSVPICPLDLLQDDRDYLPGEPKCTLPKSRRFRIGKITDLARCGLTKKEWAAKLRWQELSETEKELKKAKLRQVSPFCHSDFAGK